MSKQEVILCEGLANSLTHAIAKCPHDKLFILTDEHTHRLCRPHLDGIPALEEAEEIIIGAEDVHKNMETLAAVWQALSEKGATLAVLPLPPSSGASPTSTFPLRCSPWSTLPWEARRASTSTV